MKGIGLTFLSGESTVFGEYCRDTLIIGGSAFKLILEIIRNNECPLGITHSVLRQHGEPSREARSVGGVRSSWKTKSLVTKGPRVVFGKKKEYRK